MSHLSGPPHERFRDLRSSAHQSLAERGMLCEQSGVVPWQRGRIVVHSDFGPANEDKAVNQDFVLAWVGANGQPVRWAIAMSDGVSSSYFAELAAELACYVSLAELTEIAPDPRCAARSAFDAAGCAIGELADLIEVDESTYLPPREFDATWRYTLRQGLLLQTTLTLVWLQDEIIHCAMVGDGAVAFERIEGESHSVELFGEVDSSTNRVHALGPKNGIVTEFDVATTIEPRDEFRLAICTDGITRGLQPCPSKLFEQLDSLDDNDNNEAHRLIQAWINEQPDAFDDNLTLALVTGNGHTADGWRSHGI